MFDIKEEIKKLPDKPGVYIMKNKDDEIIYVGKAVNLKKRVSQYFRHSSNHTAKVLTMVKHITEFEYIVTDSEMEALVLECNLIKEHTPKYNIRLKDDKSYPYIKVTINEDFPRVFITRRFLKDGAKYYGPITDGFGAKETTDLINKIWPIRKCRRKLPEDIGKERPCLNCHIGQCSAPCDGRITKEEYGVFIKEIMDFLDGKHKPVTDRLRCEMEVAAEEMDFEKAAALRDKIIKIENLTGHQKLSNEGSGDSDVIAFSRAESDAVVQVFFLRNGKMTGREHFFVSNTDDLDASAVITGFVKQFYSGTAFIPKEIIVQYELEDKEIIAQMLSGFKGSKVTVTVPIKGDKARLIDLAAKNAAITLEQFGERFKREQMRTTGAVKEIQELLGIDKPLIRMEAYDISNTQGFESVGAMIVFENGKAKKSDYRKFKIKTVYGANDFASMEEVLRRRLNKTVNEGETSFGRLPDIILMDGGKPQVAAAKGILWEFGLDIPVAGMFKDERHRTNGVLFENRELFLRKDSEGFKLLTRIQDEVHRFAITYHRNLRDKKSFHWVLDDIPGIGEVRRKALLKKFSDIEAIKDADIEELRDTEGMTIKAAEAVYDFFRTRKDEILQNR